MTFPQIDAAQLRRFLNALFRYSDDGTHISLRAFYDDKNGVFEIKSLAINDREAVLAEVCAMAARAAENPVPIVLCPPIATFNDSDKADEKSLANGLVLSVECDQYPLLARKKLEPQLGPATLVVASGGQWINPETGEVEDKLHLHWRLKEPTRTPEDHRLLKEARTLATSLVGGDASNKPIVHPIRWAGSWHRKKTPVLAQIVAETGNEIELGDALEKLKEAAAAASMGQEKTRADHESKTETGESRDTVQLITAITSGREYHAPIAALAMRYLKRGMSDAQVVKTLRGFMEAVPEGTRDFKDGSVQPFRWQSRYNDIPRAVSTAREKINAEEKAWPEPLPIYAELSPVEPFMPEALLPKTLSDWVMDEAERMPCTPDFVAATVIAALGSVIGARCVIKPKQLDPWIIVPNLWGAIVGMPASKKSPAMSAALKPLDRLIAIAKKKYEDEMKDFEVGRMAREARRSALEKLLKKSANNELEGK